MATECIKHLVISVCLYIDQINDQEYYGFYEGNPYSASRGSSHLEGKIRDSVLAGPAV